MVQGIYYNPKKLQVGGLGHSLTDYISALIISKIFNIEFYHNKLTLQKHPTNRNMNIQKSNDIYKWNTILNLSDTNLPPNNLKLISIKSTQSFLPISLDKIRTVIKKNKECIFYLKDNSRIFLFDLYQMELNKDIRKGVCKEIISYFRDKFYQKHVIEPNNNIVVNVYIRCGDLAKLNTPKNLYQLRILENMYEYIKNSNSTINIISAGTSAQMKQLIMIFKKFNPTFYLNVDEVKSFKLMVSSDVLIFNFSSFPITASLYCKGIIIKKKNDKYLSTKLKYKDIKFFSNYIFTDDPEDIKSNNEIIKLFTT